MTFLLLTAAWISTSILLALFMGRLLGRREALPTTTEAAAATPASAGHRPVTAAAAELDIVIDVTEKADVAS